MNAELFHGALLRVLDENGTRFGLGIPALGLLVNRFGFDPSSSETRRALEYLADPEIGFVALVERGEYHPENDTWKITAKGINHLRTRAPHES